MDHNADAVIIGGGPAGACCGIYLQRAGISNLIIEKRSFPRDKTCAGLMTKKTLGQISKLIKNAAPEYELPDEIFQKVKKHINLYYKNELLTSSDLISEYRVVNRSDFDGFLAEIYKKSGGRLLENSVCTEYDFTSNKLTLDNGDTVKYRYLIGADGALSSTGKALGYKPSKRYFCVETLVPATDVFNDRALRIYFGIVKNGYAWIFPRGDGLCVGLGDEYKKGTEYDEILRDFLSSNGLDGENCRIKGAFIPFGECVDQSRGANNAVLIGDAGGFVDQITGEGLYFALSTGEAAANAVIGSITENKDFKSGFLRQTAEYREIVRQSVKKGTAFYKSPVMSTFRKSIKGRNGLAAFYCENQLSEYNYSYADLAKLFSDYKNGKR